MQGDWADLTSGCLHIWQQEIPQRPSTSFMREAREAEQAQRDAELRDRAAAIFRDAASAGSRAAKASAGCPPGSKPPGDGAEQPSTSTLRQALESSAIPAGVGNA